jgi:hypothetical protein
MVTKPSGRKIKRPLSSDGSPPVCIPPYITHVGKTRSCTTQYKLMIEIPPINIYLQLGMVNPCGSCVNSIYICVCVSIIYYIYYIILHIYICIYTLLYSHFFPEKLAPSTDLLGPPPARRRRSAAPRDGDLPARPATSDL